MIDHAPKYILGIDTCGPTGTVALAQLAGENAEILGQVEIEGRSYAATLVPAVGSLLAGAGMKLSLLHAIVAVNGPGSFTGVRVGLSTVKGLAEPGETPVVAVSRLEVLAWKAGCAAAALDAHRQEVFLRIGNRELLAGVADLASIGSLPAQGIAVCDDVAAALLASAWADVEQHRVAAPTAADALQLCGQRVLAGDFADLALLDGHYLRRSDAEIFGAPQKPKPAPAESA